MDLLRTALAVAITLAAFAPPVSLRSQQTTTTYRGGVDFVSVGVTVADKRHHLVTDLGAGDFAVFEDGKPQTIRAFAGGIDPGSPLHVGVLIDTSDSQQLDLAFTQSAVIKFVRSLAEAVDVTFIDFATHVRSAHYARADFSDLIDHIWTLKTGGWTSLYDAIDMYLDGAAGQSGRKVMVLYTDGRDTRSDLTLGELMNRLKSSDATVYAIGALDHQPDLFRGEQQKILEHIAEATGGVAFFPDKTRDLDKIYEQVAGEVRAQYTIGYVSTNDRTDGAWRNVEIKITRPDAKRLRMRARKGYYAARQAS